MRWRGQRRVMKGQDVTSTVALVTPSPRIGKKNGMQCAQHAMPRPLVCRLYK